MTRTRRILLAAAGLALVGGTTLAGAATPASSKSQVLPVDRQDYVTDTPVDPYNGDQSSIHVAVNGGRELARSFIHVPLNYLPPKATATSLTVTLHVTQQSDASNAGVYPLYNIDPAAAIIEACVLTTPLPANFNPSKPPGYDCARGSAVGKPNHTFDTWTFDLHDLLPYWHRNGDTGAALIPIPASASATWAVAFYANRSQALATYVVAPPRPATAPGQHSAQPRTGHAGQRQAASGQPATTEPQPVTAGQPVTVSPPVTAGHAGTASTANPGVPPTVAGSANPAPPSTQALPVATSGAGGATWPWVLAGSLLVALLAVAAAHRRQLVAAAGRIAPPGIAAIRAHPRAYTIAAAAAAWGLAFAGYSAVNAPAGGLRVAAGSEVSAGQGTSAGPAPSTAPSSGTHYQAHGNHAGQPGTGPTAPAAGGPTGPAPSPVTSGSTATSNTTAVASEFRGKGSYRVIDGVRVFFPANGGPPVADLFHGADDTIGITPDSIRLCMHAALTYGSAFHISASDLNVYWEWLNAHGGIYGRKVITSYQNDNYDPGTAVQAAQACKDWGTFLLLGGIGFDQIPAVRQWAEQNHVPYLYHVATVQNTQGLRYSFSAYPSVEQLGAEMGYLATWQFQGKKIGIIYRNSSNWTPGVTAFEQIVRAAGMQIVGAYPVTINQGNYTSEISQLQAKGAQVVFSWENALADIEIIKQAQAQAYHPAWLVAPFNIITNTLGQSSLSQPIWGAAAWDAYDPGYYGGGFASYAAQIREFEREYHQYDPSADLSGDGGDLLFDTWEAQRLLANILHQCGPQCTRNRLVGVLLAGYHRTVPPNCNVNFGRTEDHHHGGYLVNALHVIRDPNGRPNFVPVQRCVARIG